MLGLLPKGIQIAGKTKKAAIEAAKKRSNTLKFKN